jgi:hypothetical protein
MYGKIWVRPNEATMSPIAPKNCGKISESNEIWSLFGCVNSGFQVGFVTVDRTPTIRVPILSENSHVQCFLSLRHIIISSIPLYTAWKRPVLKKSIRKLNWESVTVPEQAFTWATSK